MDLAYQSNSAAAAARGREMQRVITGIMVDTAARFRCVSLFDARNRPIVGIEDLRLSRDRGVDIFSLAQAATPRATKAVATRFANTVMREMARHQWQW